MSLTTTYTWEREDGEEGSIEIEFTCAPYYPAIVSGPPSRWCDAEGGDIESIEFSADCPPEVLAEFKEEYRTNRFTRDAVEAKCLEAAMAYADNGPDY